MPDHKPNAPLAPEREPEGDIANSPIGCWFPILFVAMLVGLVLLENC